MALPWPATLAATVVFLLAGAWLARRAVNALLLPGVLGELLFGALVGPGILGVLAPSVRAGIFAPPSAQWLGHLSSLGLILFMFLTGIELRPAHRDRLGSAWVAAGGLLLPFTMGLALALWRPEWFSAAGDPGRTALFVAIALTVTALPILGRILQDVGLLTHPLATVALGAALWDDMAAWIMLALLVGSSHIGLTGNLAVNVALVGVAFLAAVWAIKFVPEWRGPLQVGGRTFAVACVALAFGAAWLTSAAGLHLFVGPLLAGLVVSRRPMVAFWLRTRVGRPAEILIIPLFFVLAGARMDHRLLLGGGAMALVVVVAVASISKTLGCYLGGRTIGMTHVASGALGVLMNARGAVAILIAEIGLEAGFLSPLGYALLVSTAFATTLLAPLTFHGYMAWVARRPTPA